MTGSGAQPIENDDLRYQAQILEQVSRTFALTIPQLPNDLYKVVANAYLLCRIADTIEDDPDLTPAHKQTYAEQFIQVLDEEIDPDRFAQDLHAHLSPKLPAAELELVLNTAKVVRVTHGFSPAEHASMRRCVAIMSTGMAHFQTLDTRHGLRDMAEMDEYCYYVAGVVGEMLTVTFLCPRAPIKCAARRYAEIGGFLRPGPANDEYSQGCMGRSAARGLLVAA